MASLDPRDLNSYRSVPNLLCWGKMLGRAATSQLQRFLDAADYLDQFQSSFRPGFGIESALIPLRRGSLLWFPPPPPTFWQWNSLPHGGSQPQVC